MKNATQMKDAKQKPHRFDPEVLREYDIRGQVGKNLSESQPALAVGLSFGTYCGAKGIKRAARPSASAMTAAPPHPASPKR